MLKSGMPLADRLVVVYATGFGSGFSPFAPGTAGSLVGVGIFWIIHPMPLPMYIAFTVALTLTGIPIATRAEKIFWQKDSPKIVIDEIAGQLIAFIAVPFTLGNVLAGFLLFRLFDIWKPFRRLEKLSGGTGVMLDDVAAGLCALAVLQLFIYLS
ncbi:MAG: phosphatidylglycerophosphatase A [Nitrospinota bacterium]